MITEKTTESGVLTVYLKGKLDTGTAPQMEKELKGALDGVRQLVLDMKELQYLSSAGLRVILKLQKSMKGKDGMIVRNANEGIREIFDLTGFTNIVRVE